ncbi:MAG: hypothetical protein HZB25_08780 [Candidatus Eisenbacteria bacterium]|nr:hypothetical protein [Candidatus Eisenbacteria bacterium]
MKSSSSVIRGAVRTEPAEGPGQDAPVAVFAPYPQPARHVRIQPSAEAQGEAAYRRGFEDGVVEGRAQGEAEVEGLRTTLDLVVREVWEHRERMTSELETDAVRLALAVAGRVVGRLSEEDRTMAERMTTEALKRVTARDRITLRVNPEDLEAVRSRREAWLRIVEGVEHFEVIEDRRVARGGALVTTLHGAVDARWTTQLVEIERMLLGERPGTDADA